MLWYQRGCWWMPLLLGRIFNFSSMKSTMDRTACGIEAMTGQSSQSPDLRCHRSFSGFGRFFAVAVAVIVSIAIVSIIQSQRFGSIRAKTTTKSSVRLVVGLCHQTTSQIPTDKYRLRRSVPAFFFSTLSSRSLPWNICRDSVRWNVPPNSCRNYSG
jgi:hypothetical protein